MTTPADPAKVPPETKALHGRSSELSWRSGQGRQPYANQGPQEAEETNCGDHCDSGDRGARSGTNLQQMEQVRGVPEVPPPARNRR